MTITSAEATALLVQGIIALAIARRSYSLTQGVPYSFVRLVAVAVLIVVLWAITEIESLVLTPWAVPYLVVADVAILVGAALISAPVAERMTEVTRTSSDEGTIRIGFVFAAFFLVLFLARLALAAVLFPNAFSFGGSAPGYLPYDQQVVVAGLDALFSLSAGLLVGRSLGIYRRWESTAPGSWRGPGGRGPPAGPGT